MASRCLISISESGKKPQLTALDKAATQTLDIILSSHSEYIYNRIHMSATDVLVERILQMRGLQASSRLFMIFEQAKYHLDRRSS